VLFDEFHERSLDADLGLALALDAQGGLREDLRLLVMSATLDGARVARLMGDAPVVASEGRAFPVETRHVERDPNRRIEEAVAEVTLRALRADPGSVLVFLPGQAEIRRTADLLAERLDPGVVLAPLYGALPPAEQDRAVAPAPPGTRKVVLATSIAETSLTIEGVRIVVDSGLARVPVYEPRGPPSISGGAAPAGRSRASAGGSGPRPPPTRLNNSRGPRSFRRIWRACSSIAPPGAWPIRKNSPSWTRRRPPLWRRPARCWTNSAPSIRTVGSPRRAPACAPCRCRRGSPGW
jgi:hypothetical protein